MLLTGIFPALTTPFYPDGRLYLKKLEHNVDRYSRTPIAGMTILGSTGEVVMLSEEEQREVLRVAVEVAAPEKVLLAGVGHESAIKTVEAAEYAAKLNAFRFRNGRRRSMSVRKALRSTLSSFSSIRAATCDMLAP